MKKLPIYFISFLLILSISLCSSGCGLLLFSTLTDDTSPLETSVQTEQKNSNLNSEKNNTQTETTIKPSDKTETTSNTPQNNNTETSSSVNKETETTQNKTTYILNIDSMKIHYPSCSSAKKISAVNRKESTESIEALIGKGYSKCGICMK